MKYLTLLSALEISLLLGSIYSFFLDTRIQFSRYKCRRYLSALLDDTVDLSPLRDGGILKKIISKGNPTKGNPQLKDNVEINWKIWLSNENLVHDSSALTEPFLFTLGATPREVIQGWEIGVRSMFEGEISKFYINSIYAFGVNGTLPLIPPNENIVCEIELNKIIPSILRSYKSIGVNESTKDELMSNLEKDKTPPIMDDFIKYNKPITEDKPMEERKFFDPKTMKLDPNQLVSGTGDNHSWKETSQSIDIEIPLPKNSQPFVKTDLIVNISSKEITVKSIENEIYFTGPLHGKIITSESCWALLERDPSSTYRGQRILLSLQKAYGYQEIWATVLDRNSLIPSSSDEEEYDTSNMLQ